MSTEDLVNCLVQPCCYRKKEISLLKTGDPLDAHEDHLRKELDNDEPYK